jgi:type VI secretion system protein ImpJ
MYLGPHHFQAQSRYFEDSLNFVTTSLWRDAYGFAGLQFDNDALRNGTLALTNGRGLFEDGLAFDLPGSDSAPPPREFTALFSPVADHLTMHLAVPVTCSRRAATRVSTMARPLPFAITAESRSFRMRNTGRDEKKSRVGCKNLQLLAEAEVTDQFVSLPAGAHCARAARANFEDGFLVRAALPCAKRKRIVDRHAAPPH